MDLIMIEFFVPGIPVPQARPRTFFHRGLNRYCTMNPTQSENWKKEVTARAYPYRPKTPIDYPIRLKLEFYLPRPQKAKDDTWACVRPDLDNYVKGTVDALQQANFFKDDAVVVWMEAKKFYSSDGRVGVQITVLGVDEKS
jgi:Holliday junction resolvase RusA-like endonuclease